MSSRALALDGKRTSGQPVRTELVVRRPRRGDQHHDRGAGFPALCFFVCFPLFIEPHLMRVFLHVYSHALHCIFPEDPICPHPRIQTSIHFLSGVRKFRVKHRRTSSTW